MSKKSAGRGIVQRQPQRRRVCLFGTSADPPTGHGGHYGIVSHLASLRDDKDLDGPLLFDEVRILPVYRHMYASKRNRLTNFELRLEMCRLAFADLSNPQQQGTTAAVVVSPLERVVFDKHAASLKDKDKDKKDKALQIGTANVLDYLRQEEPHVDFTLALGLDTFLDLVQGKWKRSNDVMEMVQGRLLVIARATTPQSDNDNDDDEKHVDVWMRQVHSQYPQGHCRLVEMATPPPETPAAISSSLARSTREEATLAQVVLPSVLEFIKSRKLYQWANEEDEDEDVAHSNANQT